MRERDSILMVTLSGLGVSWTQNPSSGLCFGTLGVPVGVFQLGWNFTSPTLHNIQHGMCESPRIGRGENNDQFSIRSSSVLTALRAPNVRFPTLRAALLLLLLLLPVCLSACLLCQLPYRGRRLAMKYLMQFRFTPFFFKKNSRGRLFFQCSWWASNFDRKLQRHRYYPSHYRNTITNCFVNVQ